MYVKRTYAVETTLTAQKVCQLLNDGNVNDLPLITSVNAGATPTALNSSATTFVSAVAMDATHVIVTYLATSIPYAVALSISGTTISAGTPIQVDSGGSSVGVVKIDSTHALTMNRNSSNAAINPTIVTLSGTTTLTKVSSGAIDTSGSDTYSFALLDATHVLLMYGYEYTSALTINGTSVTHGTNVLVSSTMNYPSLSMLDATHALLTYTGTSGYLYGTVLTVTGGTTVSVGPLTQLSTVATQYISSVPIDATHVLVTYLNSSNNFMYSVVLTVNGTVITTNTLTPINSASTTSSSITKMDATHVLVSYISGGFMWCVLLTIIGTGITVGNPIKLPNINPQNISISMLDATHVAVSYRDNITFYLNCSILVYNPTIGKIIGIAQDSIGNVMLKGVSKGHVGLTVGANYYYDINGVLSINPTGTYIGTAISTTEILIPNYTIS